MATNVDSDVHALAFLAHPEGAFHSIGLTPDRWQREAMDAILAGEDVLVVAARQSGKSTTAATLALHTALWGGTALLVAPTERQSVELMRRVREFVRSLGLSASSEGQTYIELTKAGRVLALPSNASGIRGYSAALVVLDEAAFIGDDLYTAVRPMVAMTRGRIMAISTPRGRQGWFWREWHDQASPWHRIRVTVEDISRYDPTFVERERASLGGLRFAEEYLAEFVELGGTLLRREWLRYGTPPPREALRVSLGVDLAISQREGSDYTALAAVGRDKEGRVWVLDVARARATFQDTLRLVRNLASRWHPERIAVESVQYQAAVVQELLRTTTLPVFPARPSRDKVTRAMPLIARYEQGLVWHAQGLPREFELELLSFPEGEHDDQVDALVYAWNAGEMPNQEAAGRIGW